ncbi:MAG TPA: OB-fold domain-containing protein [Acidimicrobiales bacterium]|nr:OB-fold domain-containing protein [Acidimicrobiales bacterium]
MSRERTVSAPATTPDGAPGTVPVAPGLFTEGEAPHLVGARCAACGSHLFPAKPQCPYCSSDDVRETALSSRGVLWAWTAVTAPPPGYRGDVPYGFGVVELPEGIRVLARLTVADPAALEAGQPMDLRIVPLHTDDEGRTVTTFAFAPAP